MIPKKSANLYRCCLQEQKTNSLAAYMSLSVYKISQAPASNEKKDEYFCEKNYSKILGKER